MKRIISRIILLLFLIAVVSYWLFWLPSSSFEGKSTFFIIAEDKKDKASILEEMQKSRIITIKLPFSLVASAMGVWDKIRPGKYEVKKGQSLLDIARMLKNGRLAEIKLVINRIRIKEDLAKLIGKHFSTDSASVMRYISSNDSLRKFNVDTHTVFTMILPDTYIFYWNTPLWKILRKLSDTKTQFWQNKDRLGKAKSKGLSTEEAYTLASIVTEESNQDSDKYKIASVYLNRLKAGMPLQADPTVKYAMKDFSITRVYKKYLVHPSPYNTYRHAGLPPGPISTPSAKTIDIILNAPKTDYLFFVAKSDFSGYSNFSNNYTEHLVYAKEYQKALDAYLVRKQQNAPLP